MDKGKEIDVRKAQSIDMRKIHCLCHHYWGSIDRLSILAYSRPALRSLRCVDDDEIMPMNIWNPSPTTATRRCTTQRHTIIDNYEAFSLLDIGLRRLIRALATAPWLLTFKHERVVER